MQLVVHNVFVWKTRTVAVKTWFTGAFLFWSVSCSHRLITDEPTYVNIKPCGLAGNSSVGLLWWLSSCVIRATWILPASHVALYCCLFKLNFFGDTNASWRNNVLNAKEPHIMNNEQVKTGQKEVSDINITGAIFFTHFLLHNC